MTASSYPIILAKTLEFEGGYVNHPSDPGGATNRGVTQKTYNIYRSSISAKRRSVKKITDDEVQSIYRIHYWNRIKGDRLPAGPDAATFDAGVNSGPSRGVKWLQKALDVSQDGIVGEAETIPAAAKADSVALAKKICALRLSFVQGLRTWRVFGRGWARRIAGVEALSVRLALQNNGSPPTAVGKAMEKEASESEKKAKQAKSGAQGAVSGAAAGGSGAAIDPSHTDVLWGLSGIALGLITVAILLAVLTGILMFRKHIQDERSKAYRSELENLK